MDGVYLSANAEASLRNVVVTTAAAADLTRTVEDVQ